jgi:lysophospholipase L1-like esterase
MQAVEKPPVTHRKRWLIGFLAVYLLGLHAFAIVAIFRTDIIARAGARLGIHFGNEFSLDSRAFRSAYSLQQRIDQAMRKSPVIFLGDSITEGLPPLQDLPRSLNLGFGGSTTLSTAAMIGGYRHFDQVAVVVLNVGANDLCDEHASSQEFERRLRRLSAALPARIRIVWSSILPVDPNSPRAVCAVQPNTIRQANSIIAGVCKERESCIYSDGFSKLADARGYLAPQFHVGDGVHLNPRGYEVWSDQLRRDLVRSGLSIH